MNRKYCLLILPLLLTIFTIAGCDVVNENAGKAEGTITLNGAPLAGAMIEFIPEASEGRTSYGTADADGHYVMIYYGDTEGAELGMNTVKITMPDPGDGGGERVVIPPKYNTKSEQKVDVKKGKNTFDFSIES